MSKLDLSYRETNIGNLSINPNYVWGTGSPLNPLLQVQLDISLRPSLNKDNLPKYQSISLLQMGGTVLFGNLEKIAFFITEPFCREFSRAIKGDDFPEHIDIALDPFRVKRLEEYRKQGDMELKISFWGTLLVDGLIQNINFSHPLGLKIPQSQWSKNVLERWKYSRVKIIELWFPEGIKEKFFKKAYAYVEKAKDHYNKGNDKEVLWALYLAFESIAKEIKCESPDQNAFAKLLGELENEKKEKLKFLLHYFCRYLHLGRHEPDKPVSIEHKDSEFVLIIAQAIFSYLSRLLNENIKGKEK